MMVERTDSFARNEDLEVLLHDLNTLLSYAEDVVLEQYSKPKFPVVFLKVSTKITKSLPLKKSEPILSPKVWKD